MPHDVMPSELSLGDVETEEVIDNSASHEEKSSPLASMREAGRKLVRKAKRSIGNPVLAAAMVAAGAALVAPHAAKAQTPGAEYIYTYGGGVAYGNGFSAIAFASANGSNSNATVAYEFVIVAPSGSGDAPVNAVITPWASYSPENNTYPLLPIDAYAEVVEGGYETGGPGITGCYGCRIIAFTESGPTYPDPSSASGTYQLPVNTILSIGVSVIAETVGSSYASASVSVAPILPPGYTIVFPPGVQPISAKTLGACDCSVSDPGNIVNSTPSGGRDTTADPINIATGNVFERVTDYTTAGANPLSFTRYYNSQQTALNPGTLATTLGKNWRTTYDRYLNVSSNSVTAERADGQVLNFTLQGSTWTPDSDVDYTLTNPSGGSTWLLTDHNGTVENYAVSSNVGTLQSITARNGYTQNLSYASMTGCPGGTLLCSVSDSYSRTLIFTYSGGLLQTVSSNTDSLVLSYGFTAVGGSNVLQTVSYNTSTPTQTTYGYADSSYPFAVTSITDENSNTRTWTYDSQGRATSNYAGPSPGAGPSFPANITSLSYNSDGTTTVTTGTGSSSTVSDTYTFSTLQNVPKVIAISRTAPSGTTVSSTPRTFGYDSNGYLNSSTDWNGNQTTYSNDSYGDPTTINEGIVGTSAPLRTTTISYGNLSGTACTTFVDLPCTITTPGNTTSITYNTGGYGHGMPATVTETDTTSGSTPYSTSGTARTWSMGYTTTGQLLNITGPRTDLTQETQFTYSGGILTSITDPLNHVTTINTSTGGGYPTKITDPNGVVTTLAWDTRLNLNTSTLDPSGSAGGPYVTTYAHDPANRLTQVSLPDRAYPLYSIAFGYDYANHLTTITNALGETINYALDQLGDVTGVTVKSSPSSGSATTLSHTATFDALGRMLTSVGASGQTTTFGYDPNSNLTSIIDPRANASSSIYNTTLGYDALNRLTSVIDRNGYTTSATYDAHDRITSITDPNHNTTNYTRDGFERVIQLISPDSKTTNYVYDLADNITQRTMAATSTSPIVMNRTFDAVNREVTRTFPSDPAEDVYKTYDQVSAFGFGIGRLTTMSNTTSLSSSLYTRYIAYDERGNDIGGADVFGGGAFWFNNDKYYDAASRLTAVILPSGWAQGWFRDAAGQVTGVGVQPSPYTAPVTMIAGSNGSSGSPITHLPFGPVATIPFANNITQTNSYNQDYRLTNLNDTYTPTSLGYINLSYTYDPNSNVGGSTSTPGITDNLNSANNQTMTYDRMDRLASASGNYGSLGWMYDANGNRTSQTVSGGTPDSYTYNSGTNQLSSTSLSGFSIGYDGAGAVNAVSQYSSLLFNSAWNQSEQQSNVTTPGGASLASYSYDGFGQRLAKTTSVATVFSYGKFGNLTEESNTNPQTTDYIPLDPSSRQEAFTPVGMIAIPAYPTSSSTALYFLHTDRLGTPQVVTDGASPPNKQWIMNYTPFGAAASAITNPSNITQNLRFPGMYSDPETGLYHNGAREYVPTTGLYFKTDPIGLAAGTNTYAYANGNPFKWTDTWGLVIGDYPPAPPGYNPATWLQDQWSNGKLNLTDPDTGNIYTIHPEDAQHWRHWDVQDANGKSLGQCPQNSSKPWPGQTQPPYGNQSASDPSGNQPGWQPQTATNPSWLQKLLPEIPLPPLFVIQPQIDYVFGGPIT